MQIQIVHILMCVLLRFICANRMEYSCRPDIRFGRSRCVEEGWRNTNTANISQIASRNRAPKFILSFHWMPYDMELPHTLNSTHNPCHIAAVNSPKTENQAKTKRCDLPLTTNTDETPERTKTQIKQHKR